MKKCEMPQTLHHQMKCGGNLIVLKTSLVTAHRPVRPQTCTFTVPERIGELTVRNLQDIFGILVRNIFLGQRVELNQIQQEFERTVTRELKEDVAEFESEYYRSYPVGSIGQTNS